VRNVHFALRVGYHGGGFSGWQEQADQATVAGSLRAAAEPLFAEPPRLRGASRTDSGVHALDQRALLSGVTKVTAERLPAALNARLPAGVRVFEALEVGADWDPKGDSFAKRYRYDVWVGPACPPALLDRVWWIRGTPKFDLAACSAAAAALVGEHDFEAFRSANCQARHARRAIWRFDVEALTEHDWQPACDQAGAFYRAEVCGNAFAHNMVRIMVGSAFDVGLGRLAPGSLDGVLAGRQRAAAGRTAPAQGLTLMHIYFPGDERASGVPSGWRWPGCPW
jgi:tRNA pseudouridine38-40 synthase